MPEPDYNTDVFGVYLSRIGFTGQHIEEDYTEWFNGKTLLKIPRKKSLTTSQVESLLSLAGSSRQDFEYYLEGIKLDSTFDFFIDKSLKTPSIKSKNK